MRRAALLSLLLLLPGCWMGGDFYTDADLTTVIAPGDYRATSLIRGEMDGGVLRVTVRPDGLTDVVPVGEDGRADRGDAFALGFAPLNGDGELFVTWQVQLEGQPLNRDTRAYFLLRRDDNGYTLFLPLCDGSMTEAARRASARVIEGTPSYCRFDNRASLETALRAATPLMPSAVRLDPVSQ